MTWNCPLAQHLGQLRTSKKTKSILETWRQDVTRDPRRLHQLISLHDPASDTRPSELVYTLTTLALKRSRTTLEEEDGSDVFNFTAVAIQRLARDLHRRLQRSKEQRYYSLPQVTAMVAEWLMWVSHHSGIFQTDSPCSAVKQRATSTAVRQTIHSSCWNTEDPQFDWPEETDDDSVAMGSRDVVESGGLYPAACSREDIVRVQEQQIKLRNKWRRLASRVQ